ncbi:MAG TPA: serine hydrolase [Actinomycetota bacterium]|nr:serine hydrolase [Actinomycetota bacterium]
MRKEAGTGADRFIAAAMAIASVVILLLDVSGVNRSDPGAAFGKPRAESDPNPTPTSATGESDLAHIGALRAIGSQRSVLVAQVTSEGCIPRFTMGAQRRLAIASAFKLHLLAVVTHEIDAGRLEWTDTIEIEEFKKSLGMGMSSLRPGATRTVLQVAKSMIAVSDNTATDHLLFHLGRAKVTRLQDRLGLWSPRLNRPFLSTREAFLLKLAVPPRVVSLYAGGSTSERARILSWVRTRGLSPDDLQDAGDDPLYIDSVEWFASAEDLCRTMAYLKSASAQPGLHQIRSILSLNPGVPYDSDEWTYVGYKGGSEPGVLNLTWLLRHRDGMWLVIVGTFNDQESPIDEMAAVESMLELWKQIAEAVATSH